MMRLWEFKIVCEIDDDGAECTSYELSGDVTLAEVIGEIEVTKAQLITDTVFNDEGDTDE